MILRAIGAAHLSSVVRWPPVNRPVGFASQDFLRGLPGLKGVGSHFLHISSRDSSPKQRANGIALSLFAFADKIDNPRNVFCQFPFYPLFFRLEASFPSQRLVALLGFAYRHISVEFALKARKQAKPNPLPVKVKTVADWIQVKLRENGMSPFHLGAKMGIATSVVNAWKDGLARPQNRQMREMVTILGRYRHGSFDVIAVGLS